MDRGGWWVIVHGLQRVGHDWMTNIPSTNACWISSKARASLTFSPLCMCTQCTYIFNGHDLAQQLYNMYELPVTFYPKWLLFRSMSVSLIGQEDPWGDSLHNPCPAQYRAQFLTFVVDAESTEWKWSLRGNSGRKKEALQNQQSFSFCSFRLPGKTPTAGNCLQPVNLPGRQWSG